MITGMKAEKMIMDWAEAWNSHDIEKILSYVSDEIFYEGLGGARVKRGKQHMKDWMMESFSAFPDMRFAIKSVISGEDSAACEWVMSGTLKGAFKPLGWQPTGKAFSVRGASIVEINGGKIIRNTDYYDGATVAEQLGLALR